jgi:hypothetical protein
MLLGDKIKADKMGWLCSTRGREQIFVWKFKGKRAVGRYSRRWEDNIGVDLGDVASCGMELFGSRHGAVAGSCEHSNKPLVSIKCREFLDYLSDY